MSATAKKTESLTPLQKAIIALKEARAKIEALEKEKNEAIAIVGMGCRFPGGANTPAKFWDLLKQGQDGIVEVPGDRWDMDRYYDEDPDVPNKMYARYGGFIEDVDQFDAGFFGITPREAIAMDPQQRLLLEVSWEALENAGIAPRKLNGSQTGVFVGIGLDDYAKRQVKHQVPIDAYTGSGNAFCFASGRLSYLLGLQGPSLAVDTACSTSLVTVHLACQSLRNKECDLALAGGVSLMLSPEVTLYLSKTRALSPDGKCKTFDKGANGYVRGEGCGMVILKRLSDAVQAGDNILGVIRGSAVNQDGPSSGLTVPNGSAQQAVIRQALANAKVKPDDISYLEAHGTGTALGDPIEMRAIDSIFGQGRSPQDRLTVGSVKTNIGHLEIVAGMASLLKVILSLQHQQIPPHLHFQELNPNMTDSAKSVHIPTQIMPWEATEAPRRAAISSFGLSGTNAHIIVEEAPGMSITASEVERPSHLLMVSAKNEAALEDLVKTWRDYLEQSPDLNLGDLAFSANTGRAQFNHRVGIIAQSTTEAQQELQGIIDQQPSLKVIRGNPETGKQKKITFLFTGQGSQYVGMGRQLYETQPTFREALEQCDRLLQPYLERSLLAVIYPENERDEGLLQQATYTQPALFAIEYALCQLWQAWGVKPDAVIGHSIGEYVAACVAGVYSLEEGLKLIAHRGRLMQQLPQNGAMMAVFASRDTVETAIAGYEDNVTIATVNSPQNVVISGDEAAINLIQTDLENKNIEVRRLKVSHAFHSPKMEPMLDEFQQIAQEINYQVPQLDWVSTVTGDLVNQAIDANYWTQQVRHCVQFAPAIETLGQQGDNCFLEMGPHPILTRLGQQTLPDKDYLWLPSLHRQQDNWQQLLQSVAKLAVSGVAIDWEGFDQDYSRRRLPLPTYPFQRQRYWLTEGDEPALSVTSELPVSEEKSTVVVESLETQLINLVADITGLNKQQLSLDVSLEGALGLDSIMMTQLMNGILKLVDEEKRGQFKEVFSLRDLMQLSHLRQLLDILEPFTQEEKQTQAQKTPSNVEESSVRDGLDSDSEWVDILHSQLPLLMSYWSLESNSLFTKIQIEGNFNLEIAQKSWQDLVQRHPMLRARFHIKEGATQFSDYGLEILKNPTVPTIEVKDVTQLSADEQQQSIEDEVFHWLNYGWDLRQWPLHRFSVLQLSDSVYQLFLGNEHLISDGLSNHVILREFLELYRANVAQESPNLPPALTVETYRRQVETMNLWQDTEEDKALAEYNNTQGNQVYRWNPKQTKIKQQTPLFYNQKYVLSAETTAQLLEKTRQWRIPMNALLLGTFIKTMATLDPQSQTIGISIPTSGRVYPEVDTSGVISSFAQNLALSFTPPQAEEPSLSFFREIEQTVKQSIGSGLDRAQTRQLGIILRQGIVLENGQLPNHSLSMMEEALKSNLYLPYTGQTRIATDYGFFSVTDYQAGGMNGSGTIDILQEIFDHRLHLFASYDYNVFDVAIIDQLMTTYLEQIEALGSLSIATPEVAKVKSSLVTDGDTAANLRQITGQICHWTVEEDEMDDDLEADLGLDSLERIRLVTQLEGAYGKQYRQQLLDCRTLAEMVTVVTPIASESKAQGNPQIAANLRQITGQICHWTVEEDEMDDDLEADLGLDSLERIRLVTQLEGVYGKQYRQQLLDCRTLAEMETVLTTKPVPFAV